MKEAPQTGNILVISSTKRRRSTVETSFYFLEWKRTSVFGDGGQSFDALMEGGQVGEVGEAVGHKGEEPLNCLEQVEIHERNLEIE